MSTDGLFYLKNKGRKERARWLKKKIAYNEEIYKVMYISSEYPKEFMKELPKLGSKFHIVDVGDWKSYPASMNEYKYQISSLNELFKDKGNKIKEGMVIEIAISPEIVNELWLDLDRGENWMDKDIVKIMALLIMAIRAFSEKSSINLNDKNVRDALKYMIEECYKLLKELDLIKLNEDYLLDTSGLEDPVYNIFRRTYRDFHRDTEGLFKNIDNKYFLDIYQNSKIADISNLWKLVVDKKILSLEERYKIVEFCKNISNDKHAVIFNKNDDHIFYKPEYEIIIKDTILFC